MFCSFFEFKKEIEYLRCKIIVKKKEQFPNMVKNRL
jgi:hypothetical protein